MKAALMILTAMYAWHLASRATSRRRMFAQVDSILGRR